MGGLTKWGDLTPKEIEGFTLNGKINVEHFLLDGTNNKNKLNGFYDKKLVDSMIKKIKNKEVSYYGKTDKELYTLLERINIEGKSVEKFDVVFSISSFEHDGLGRYGDPINPTGDIEAMINVKSMLKKDGILFLAVPVGVDTIFWNAHRIYGKHRFPKLIDGWEIIDKVSFHEKDEKITFRLRT